MPSFRPASKRLGLVAGAVVVLAGVLVAAMVRSETRAGEPAGPVIPWVLAETGAGERSLVVVYESGGCDSPDIQGSATETATTVTVVVRRQHPTPAGACPAIARIGRGTVPLPGPLAGRRIIGPNRQTGDSLGFVRRGNHDLVLVPRLAGFAPPDARPALENRALRTHFCHDSAGLGLPRIVAQRPEAEQAVRGRSVVRAEIARGGGGPRCRLRLRSHRRRRSGT